MSRRPPKPLTVILAGLALACCYSPPVQAQAPPHDVLVHPENWVEVQDGMYVKRLNADGVPLGDSCIIAAAYRFEFVYDSTSRVQYLFSECMHNGVRPRLLAWKRGHIHSSAEGMMSDSSRTASFPITTGDTISFYREFKWYDPKQQRQDTNNFRSLDTIDYAVELVRHSTGARIALLDSFGVLASPVAGAPMFYGTRPIIARVIYRVPLVPPGDSAFVRVRVDSRGDGPYLPIRKDDYTVCLSRLFDRGRWDYYLSLYGGALNKRPVNELNNPSLPNGSLLTVSTTAPGHITIQFSEPAGVGPVEVAIYDAAGNHVFMPYATRAMRGPGVVSYDVASSGTYFVTLLRGGTIIDVRRVNITL